MHTYSDLRCDLQVVSSGTAANNMAIVLKQLRTAKCANWDELATMWEILVGRMIMIMSVANCESIRAYMVCSCAFAASACALRHVSMQHELV